MQSSQNILTPTARPKVPAKPSSGKFSKDTKIGHFLKFFKGGTKGKSLKSAPNLAAPNTLRRKSGDLVISILLKVKSSKNILTQTAGPKVPAKPSSGKFSKDTKIGHFLKFFKGGTKGKSLKIAPILAAPKTLRRKSGDLLISIGLKCNHRRRF